MFGPLGSAAILTVMKLLCAIILTLLLLTTAATPQSEVSRGSVRGRVLCEDTQGPARRAYVSLQAPVKPRVFQPQEDVFGATTNLDGSFAISNVRPGEYYVVVNYPGYLSAKDYIFPSDLSPELTGSREALPSFVQRVAITSSGTVDVEIRLKRGGSISGSVAYTDGAPVQYIALNPVIRMSNGTFARVLNVAHADSSGRYRIDGLPDGSYAIAAADAGSDAVTVLGGDKIGSGGWITFEGGGMRASKARLVVVTSPQESAGMDITIPLTGVHEIAGTVSAPDGHRLNHGLVRIFPTGEPLFDLAAPLRADGTFRFHRVPPDSYSVRVEDASDWKIVRKTDGATSYDERTLVQRYGTGTKDIKVADADITNLSVTVFPAR
jgi:hypothetical protein